MQLEVIFGEKVVDWASGLCSNEILRSWRRDEDLSERPSAALFGGQN